MRAMLSRLTILLGCGLLLATGGAQAPPTTIASVHFLGIQRFRQTELEQATHLAAGAPFSEEAVKSASNALSDSGAFSKVHYRYRLADGGEEIEFQLEEASAWLPCRLDNFVWASPADVMRELQARVPLFHDRVPLTGDLLNQVAAALTAVLHERGIAGQVAIKMEGELGGPVRAALLEVDGRPTLISSMRFPGASEGMLSQLNAVVARLLGTSYHLSFLEAVEQQQLSRLYQSAGFLDAHLSEPTVQLDPNIHDGGVRVEIAVDEGPVYHLSGLRWSGNQVLPTAALAKLVRTRLGAVVDLPDVETQLSRARKAYGSKGYLGADFQVIAEREPDHQVLLHIKVKEGDQFAMGPLQVTGFSPGLTRTLEAEWMLPAGRPFNVDYPQQFADQVAESQHGRILRLKISPDLNTHLVSVQVVSPEPAR